MFQEYLNDQKIFIINAKSPKQAFEKYAKKMYKDDDLFIDDLQTKTANMSFYEKFFGFVEQPTSEEIASIVKNSLYQNMLEFFNGNEGFAKILYEYFINYDDVRTPLEVFPDDMLLFMWVNQDEEGSHILLDLDSLHSI